MTTETLWTCELDGWLEHRPVLAEGSLFVRSGGNLVAVSAADGTVQWSTPVDPNGNTGQFLSGSGEVVVGSRNVADRTVLLAVDHDGQPVWEVETDVIVVDAVAATRTEILAFGGADGRRVFVRVDSASGAATKHDVPWLPDRIAIVDGSIIGSKRDTPGLVRLDSVGVATHHFSADPVYALAAAANHVAVVELVDDEPLLRLLSRDLDQQWDQPASSTIIATDAEAIVCGARAVAEGVELIDVATGVTQWVAGPLADEFVSFAIFDEVVVARGLTMLWVLDRDDGAVLSEHLMGAAVVAEPGTYYVAAMKTLARHRSAGA